MSQVVVVHAAQRAALAGAWHRDQVLTTTVGLVERARAHGVPVVWVRRQDEQRPHGSDAWQLVDELVPLEDEPIVDSRWPDAFTEEELGEVLLDVEATGLVVCGADALHLPATVFSALARGLEVVVAADALTSRPILLDQGELLSGREVVTLVGQQLGQRPAPEAALTCLGSDEVVFRAAAARPADLDLSEELLAEQDIEEDREDMVAGR